MFSPSARFVCRSVTSLRRSLSPRARFLGRRSSSMQHLLGRTAVTSDDVDGSTPAGWHDMAVASDRGTDGGEMGSADGGSRPPRSLIHVYPHAKSPEQLTGTYPDVATPPRPVRFPVPPPTCLIRPRRPDARLMGHN